MKYKVLIVDDEPSMLKMYDMSFKLDDFDVLTADSGAAALDLLRAPENKPDLILLDIMMPEMNGLEFMEKMQGIVELAGIPIIVLTNVGGMEGVNRRAMELGAKDYIEKVSVTPKELVEKVKHFLTDAH